VGGGGEKGEIGCVTPKTAPRKENRYTEAQRLNKHKISRSSKLILSILKCIDRKKYFLKYFEKVLAFFF
jgi:hypothetical protein